MFADQSASVAALLDDAALSGRPPVVTATPSWPWAPTSISPIPERYSRRHCDQRANLEAKQRYQQQLTEIVADKRVSVDEAGGVAAAALVDVKGELAELVAAEQQRKIAEAARQQQEEIGASRPRRPPRLGPPRHRHRPPARAPVVVAPPPPPLPRPLLRPLAVPPPLPARPAPSLQP